MSDNRGMRNGQFDRRPRRDARQRVPSQAGARPGRDRRRSVGLIRPRWLADWRVRSKLAAVLVIPLAAFVALAGVNVTASVSRAEAFGDGGRIADLARQVSGVTHELQRERDLSAGVLVGRNKQAAAQKADADKKDDADKKPEAEKTDADKTDAERLTEQRRTVD